MVLVSFCCIYSFERKLLFYNVVEFDEFVNVMASMYQRKFTDEEMHRAFKCFDTDNSGE